MYLRPSCIQTFSQRLLQDSHQWHLRPSCIEWKMRLALMTLTFVNYSFLETFEQIVYGFKYEPITFPIILNEIQAISNARPTLCFELSLCALPLNPKRAEGGGGGIRPINIFCYTSAGCYFFALKLYDFFSSSLALDLRPFSKKSDLGL